METKKYILYITLILIGLVVESCKKDEDPSPVDLRKNELSATWEVGIDGSVILDNNNVTSYFSDFALTVNTDFSYSTVGLTTPNPWVLEGSWEFASDTDGNVDLNKIVRDDGLIVTIGNLSDYDLQLSFIHDASVHLTGRISNVTGQYTFQLKKVIDQ